MTRVPASQAHEASSKAASLAAFQRHCRMSALLSAAGLLKLGQARALALAHLHAWLRDGLHTTFYLCWWRWRRRAVGRVRWRAALGLHMYRARWLHLELALKAWRKAAAALARTHTAAPVDADAGSTAGDGSGAAAGDSSDVPQLCAAGAAPLMHASLADYPCQPPWRRLLWRRDVMAPRGLAAPAGLKLGRAVRGLRMLEGSFSAQDSPDTCVGVWRCGLVGDTCPAPSVATTGTLGAPWSSVHAGLAEASWVGECSSVRRRHQGCRPWLRRSCPWTW
jgi:hypothetical protein